MDHRNIFKLFIVFVLMVAGNQPFWAQQKDDAAPKTPAKTTISEEPAGNGKGMPSNVEGGIRKDVVSGEGEGLDSRNDRYRIGLQDTLEITVYRHPELSWTVPVSEKGYISVARVDRPIYVVCKTETEVAEELAREYFKFLKKPYINVKVKEQNSQPVAVIGAVEKPDSFSLNRRVRLLELLAKAGGPDKELAGTELQIARVGGISGCKENEAADSEEIFEGKTYVSYKLRDVLENRKNPWVQPGDIVRVLEADVAYVVGNVHRPSKIVMKDRVTVSQAIAAAGGMLPQSRRDVVLITRTIEGKKLTQPIPVDLTKIAASETEDIELLKDDIIEVQIDKGKKLRSDIFKIFSGGLGNLPSVIVGRPY